MKVHVKGGEKKSKSLHGSPFYVIVRDDVINPNPNVNNNEVFMFVNSNRMQLPIINEGDLSEVCPAGVGSTPWKCYNQDRKVVHYNQYLAEYNGSVVDV